MGLTFKENVADLRNSRVPDIVRELGQFRIAAIVHDPLGSPDQALHEYGIELSGLDDLTDIDGLILAVPHDSYLINGTQAIASRLRPGGVLIDVKSVIPPDSVPDGVSLWSL
jgi:UDP-N-acetyl-D-galactosamine dehydrogenase